MVSPWRWGFERIILKNDLFVYLVDDSRTSGRPQRPRPRRRNRRRTRFQHVLRNPPQQPGRASGTNTLKFYTAVPECLVNRGNELFKYVRTYGGKPLYICLCSLNFSYGVEESELWVFYEGKNGFESALSCWLCSAGVVTYDRNIGCWFLVQENSFTWSQSVNTFRLIQFRQFVKFMVENSDGQTSSRGEQ
jgi:hypothetical protein